MKHKKRLTILTVILLAIIALTFHFSDTWNTFRKSESNFAIYDTSKVTRFFLSDKSNRKVELVKTAPGEWIVNEKYNAINDAVNLLLKTMASLDVRAKVSQAEHDNVIRRMSSIGVKVEIYQSDFRIKLGTQIKLFPYEKLSKIYYVGDATKDNIGTYMLMEGAEHPYIIQIRGFNGFLFSRYSTKEEDWRDHSIFGYRLADIDKIKLEVPGTPEDSWELLNPDNRNFEIISLAENKRLTAFDTMRVIEYLGSFINVKFETFINDIETKDSIISSQPWHILTMTDRSGKVQSIKTFRKKATPGETDLNDNPVIWDRDRLYALVNDDKDFVLIQFFIFDRILRPLHYFNYNSDYQSLHTFKAVS